LIPKGSRPGQLSGRSEQYLRRSTDLEPNRGWRAVGLIAVIVALLDWSTKAFVAGRFPLDEISAVWGGRLALWHVQNPALILGLFGDVPLDSRKLITFTLALATLVLLARVIVRTHRLRPVRRPWAWLFCGLIFGGMLGNLGERLLYWNVTDFLSLRWGQLWLPPGNIADLAILLAVPIAPIVIACELEARGQRRAQAAKVHSELASTDAL
jgi:lipoprotein signal peptidase